MAADLAAIRGAAYFTVVRYVGREPGDPVIRGSIWDREEVPTLAAALERRAELGADAQGRRPMIYAVTEDRMTVHISDEYLPHLA